LSSDLFLTASHRGAQLVRVIDPFTRLELDVFPWLLSEQELTAAKNVLLRFDARRNDDATWVIQISETSQIEVLTSSAGDVQWHIYLSSLGPRAAQFVFELAHAGNFVIHTGGRAVATSEAVQLRVAEREPDCVLATSVEDMLERIREDY
jgi:hypothetical protein